jgi:type IV secretion system protein VirB1
MLIDPALVLACAPQVASTTMQAIVHVESGGDPYVINIVGVGPTRAKSAEEAIARTVAAVAAGRNVAMGLMQVTTETAGRLGYTVNQMFDACTNLQAGARVITDRYQAASATRGPGQPALQAALSAYNTGNFHAGFANGYVALYYGGHAALLSHGAHDIRGALRTVSMPINPYMANPTVFIRQERVTHEPAKPIPTNLPTD